MMKHSRGRCDGFSVIELLVTLSILGIVTSILSIFLVSSLRLTTQTEARNEMQVNLRSAMELVSTDVFSAGSRGVPAVCSKTTLAPALNVTNGSVTGTYRYLARYCDPYTNVPTEVAYEIRVDATYNSLPTLYRRITNLNTTTTAGFQPSIPGILGLRLEFTCIPGKACPTTANPTAAFEPADVISVTVKLAGHSTRKASGASYPSTTLGSFTITPVNGYYYQYAEQAVRPVNLGR